MINGNTITDPSKVPSHFNNHFSNIAKNIANKIPKTNHNYREYLKEPTENSFILHQTTNEEIESVLKNLTNDKAFGPNSIPTVILKHFRKTISIPLTKLVNLSFDQGKFPSIIKIAKVLAIFKKGDKLDADNYRLVSLLSNLSKIIEKLMHKRLYFYLEQNKVFYPFPPFIEITEEIREACDKGLFACGVYLDFKKAFDTVKHEILLSKLQHYGVTGIANDWMRSFLTNRKQYTSNNGYDSTPQDITHGVPQGSGLGLLLFILFINDLHTSVKTSKVHHFADDTNLLFINKSLKMINKLINHDLVLLVQWLRANKISLNASKTELVLFRKKGNDITNNLNFRISGEKIKLSRTVKYFGVILNKNLLWQDHLNTLIPKLSRAVGLLSKIRYNSPNYLLRTIYFSIFNSHMIYTCQVWELKENQIKIISEIQTKPINHLVLKVYKNSKILKLQDYIKLLNCMFTKDVLAGNHIPKFENVFMKISVTHKTQN